MAATLIIAGRFLLGLYFFQAGVRNFMKFDVHTGLLAKKGVPLPHVSLLAALIVQVLGGASVALGVLPAAGAVGLVLFTTVANVLYHNFWAYSGVERGSHVNAVLTNLAIVGGLLLVIAISW